MSIKRGVVLCKLESINKMELYGANKVINMTTSTKWKPYSYRRKPEDKNFLCSKVRIMHKMHKYGQESKKGMEKWVLFCYSLCCYFYNLLTQ